jgi:hypothetical protein
MSLRLQRLLAELAKAFGKTTRWHVLCQEQNATTESEQIRLAEQVLAELATDTVAAGHAQWARLRGAKDQPAPLYKATGF